MRAISLPAGPPVRARLEQLARDFLAGRVHETHVFRELDRHSPLPEDDAAMVFLDLREAISDQLTAPWWEVVPDAVGTDRDEQADDACRARIELALDALESGAL